MVAGAGGLYIENMCLLRHMPNSGFHAQNARLRPRFSPVRLIGYLYQSDLKPPMVAYSIRGIPTLE